MTVSMKVILQVAILQFLFFAGCDRTPRSKGRYYQSRDKVRVTIFQRFEEPKIDLDALVAAQPAEGRIADGLVTVEYPTGLKLLAEKLAKLVLGMSDHVRKEFGVRWTWQARLRLVRIDRPPSRITARRQHSRGVFKMILFVPPSENLEGMHTANRLFPHSFVHEMTELGLAFPGEKGNPVLLDYATEEFNELNHTRWFRDGYASYVGECVAEEFCKRGPAERLHPRPFSALHKLRPLLFEWIDSPYSMSEDYLTKDEDFYRAGMGYFYLVEARHGRPAIRQWIASFERGALLNARELATLFKKTFGHLPQRLLREWKPSMLGVRGISMSRAIARSRSLEFEPGVLVLEMKESGPAASAELRIGDIIQSVSRKRIQNLDTLERALNAAGPGNCQLRINRAGKEIQARVKLRIRPGDAAGIWE
jgi:hypothetical protein